MSKNTNEAYLLYVLSAHAGIRQEESVRSFMRAKQALHKCEQSHVKPRYLIAKDGEENTLVEKFQNQREK